MDKLIPRRYYCAVGVVLLIVSATKANASAPAAELSCYQCEKNTSTECEEKDLKPCASPNDRCVIHVSKNARDGFRIKRECGLAPCNFDDNMAAKVLGFQCDQSKPEFSCVHCCKENGCNKNGVAELSKPNKLLYLLVSLYVLMVCLLNVAKDFMPPYVEENKKA